MKQMRLLGAEMHGINQRDPLFKAPFKDLHLQNNSPAVKSGIDLGPPFNKDKDGTERDKNGHWDIGCWEFPCPKYRSKSLHEIILIVIGKINFFSVLFINF